MNLTWLGFCNLPRNPLNLTWHCTTASWNLLRNILRNPVEPDLALHQDLLRNLLRNPVEPDPALHQSLPDLRRTFSGTLLDLALHLSLPNLLLNLLWNPDELDRLCTKASETFSGTLMNLVCTRTSQTLSGTFSGTLLNLTWPCTKAS